MKIGEILGKTDASVIGVERRKKVRIMQILARADAIRKRKASSYTVTYEGADIKRGLFNFSVYGMQLYTQKIQIAPVSFKLVEKEFKKIKDEDEALDKLIELSPKIDILVYCDCPDFIYTFSYLASKLGYGLMKETRPPLKRNRFLRGSVCKHLIAVLNYIS